MPGRVTNEPKEGSSWSRTQVVGDGESGGTSAHVTHFSNDGKGNSERTSSDITPSPSGGWTVSDTHTTQQ